MSKKTAVSHVVLPAPDQSDERVKRLSAALIEAMKLHLQDVASQSADGDFRMAAMWVAGKLDEISPTIKDPNRDN